MTGRLVFALAAGGTGGHLFPAEALAAVLDGRGHAVHLITDARGKQYATAFLPGHVHQVASETLRAKTPGALFAMVKAIFLGFLASRRILKRTGAHALVAFGGYPSVPPGLAAARLRLPIMLHEQNAVMGRGNRILAELSKVIATGFETVAKTPEKVRSRCRHTGNPIRPAISEAHSAYEPPHPDGPLHLLVFGGSQGAMIFSKIVPAALVRLPEDMRARLRLVQQCRPEDIDAVRAIYAEAGIEADLQTFFTDMPNRLALAHLVVARAGASTVGELTVMGRPSVLVPLPGSLDQDQKANATVLSDGGAAEMILQTDFSPESLARTLETLFGDPQRLAAMAAAARALAVEDAAERLADLAEAMVEETGTPQ
ncbi:MAG: undecaprenyldiphospho-muramoylpentapeptide beta-N-acetylglucosaminyltransferase [Rhodobiaceae bacterium]|nr:undecaprenyldiphospho-muramoylpentapeptide beta-N-acetylglucosaminyltransferase [Rhodobiaceae bacterium]